MDNTSRMRNLLNKLDRATLNEGMWDKVKKLPQAASLMNQIIKASSAGEVSEVLQLVDQWAQLVATNPKNLNKAKSEVLKKIAEFKNADENVRHIAGALSARYAQAGEGDADSSTFVAETFDEIEEDWRDYAKPAAVAAGLALGAYNQSYLQGNDLNHINALISKSDQLIQKNPEMGAEFKYHLDQAMKTSDQVYREVQLTKAARLAKKIEAYSDDPDEGLH